jgi:hypothetical protein
MVVEINREETPISSKADLFLKGAASEWLERIKESLQ